MKQGKWTFILISSNSKRDHSIQISSNILVCMLILVIMSGVGLFNGIRFGIRYSYAHSGVKKQMAIHDEAVHKVQFLKKMIEQEKREIKKFVTFEDAVRCKYGMNTISEDVRKAGTGGPPSAEELYYESLEDLEIKQAVCIEKEITSLINQADLLHMTLSRTNKHTKRLNDFYAQRPSIMPAQGRITSGFGLRFHPISRIQKFHDGIDIANNQWSPVISTAAGIVTFVGKKKEQGNIVSISHEGSGYTTRYAHLIRPAVVEGQVVNRGELIGYMGNTGLSTGPHLHYEIIKGDGCIDPVTSILPSDVVVD